MVLDIDNTTLGTRRATPVAARLARRALEQREADYADEIRRLIDAGVAEMRKRGTASTPRVADIVAAAGLSNEAFYRHFKSKDALVVAILRDGTERLVSYLAHQMAKDTEPEDRIRRWVAGVLAQADDDSASTTLAVLANAGGAAEGIATGRHPASASLAALLHEPIAALGNPEPELVASLAAHAVLGQLTDHLWQGTPVRRKECERATAFVLDACHAKTR